MNIVSYGGGTNSTAMLVGMYERGIPVDLILFADPGGEQPYTYEYLPIMDDWLARHGMPRLQTVCCTSKDEIIRGEGQGSGKSDVSGRRS